MSRTRKRGAGRARLFEVFHALTGVETNSMTPDALPASFLDRVAPTPRDLLDHYGSVLQVLTANVLRRHTAGIVEQGAWTYRRLLAIRGFGVVCLLDILGAMAGAGDLAESDAVPSTGDHDKARSSDDPADPSASCSQQRARA